MNIPGIWHHIANRQSHQRVEKVQRKMRRKKSSKLHWNCLNLHNSSICKYLIECGKWWDLKSIGENISSGCYAHKTAIDFYNIREFSLSLSFSIAFVSIRNDYLFIIDTECGSMKMLQRAKRFIAMATASINGFMNIFCFVHLKCSFVRSYLRQFQTPTTTHTKNHVSVLRPVKQSNNWKLRQMWFTSKAVDWRWACKK